MKPLLPRQCGLTLIEAAVTTAVLAILVGVAAPSFDETRQRRTLEGAAAQLETDLQLARAEAVARNESVRVAFTRGEDGSCYVMHNGSAGECNCSAEGAVMCEGDSVALRSVHFPAGGAVQLSSNSASILFDASKGTVTPTATLRLQSPIGDIHQVVNIMGRVRSCSPGAAVTGYRAC